MSVYHFTDTARLPWILDAGELRAGANVVGNFPDPDFIWVTTCEAGDDTAAGNRRTVGFRSGARYFVRFTLRDEDFEPWPDITRNYPAWTASEVVRLEGRAAHPERNPALWRARVAPLPRTAWQAIHVRSYQQPQWKPIPLDTPALTLAPHGKTVMDGTAVVSLTEGVAKAVKIGNRVFSSVRSTAPDGRTGYAIPEAPALARQ
jgi:hypothetical protein